MRMKTNKDDWCGLFSENLYMSIEKVKVYEERCIGKVEKFASSNKVVRIRSLLDMINEGDE